MSSSSYDPKWSVESLGDEMESSWCSNTFLVTSDELGDTFMTTEDMDTTFWNNFMSTNNTTSYQKSGFSELSRECAGSDGRSIVLMESVSISCHTSGYEQYNEGSIHATNESQSPREDAHCSWPPGRIMSMTNPSSGADDSMDFEYDSQNELDCNIIMDLYKPSEPQEDLCGVGSGVMDRYVQASSALPANSSACTTPEITYHLPAIERLQLDDMTAPLEPRRHQNPGTRNPPLHTIVAGSAKIVRKKHSRRPQASSLRKMIKPNIPKRRALESELFLAKAWKRHAPNCQDCESFLSPQPMEGVIVGGEHESG